MTIKEKIDELKKELGDKGRIVVRPSGTEPKIRIMVEGENQNQIEDVLNQLVEVVSLEIGE